MEYFLTFRQEKLIFVTGYVFLQKKETPLGNLFLLYLLASFPVIFSDITRILWSSPQVPSLLAEKDTNLRMCLSSHRHIHTGIY